MSRSDHNATARRIYVTGRGDPILRPPWSDETSVKQSCTSCGACILSCPEGILIEGPAQTPIVDFTNGPCTFCTKCAEVCDEGVFGNVLEPAWNLTAAIQDTCMLKMGVSCQICADACLDEAIKFDLSHRPVGALSINVEACNGCGACASVCPTSSIKIETSHMEPVHA